MRTIILALVSCLSAAAQSGMVGTFTCTANCPQTGPAGPPGSAFFTMSWTGQTTVVLDHELNSTAVVVKIYDASGNEVQAQNVAITDANDVTLSFGSPFTGSAVVVGGAAGGGGGGWQAPVRYSGNPVIPYGGTGWEASQTQEPVVVADPINPGNLIMFYAAMAAPVAYGHMAIGRATATVANPTSWTEYSANPILTMSDSIRLDSVQYEGSTWYLYYTDYTNNTINLATSTDGFAFSPSASNPVLSPTGQGCTDGTVVSQGAVIDDGGTWRMYYSYRTSVSTLQGIRYATSPDGVSWTKQGCSDILSVGATGSYDSTYIEWHQVFQIGSQYFLSYDAYNGWQWTANLAASSSPGSGWAKSSHNPIFSGSGVSGEWDQIHVATPGWYAIGGAWLLFYQGSAAAPGSNNYAFGNWSIGSASLPSGETPAQAFP